jgi:hypothetical protein
VANDQRAGTQALGLAKDRIRVEAASLVVAHNDEPWREEAPAAQAEAGASN